MKRWPRICCLHSAADHGEKPLPVPVASPHQIHIFNGYTFGLRHKKEDECLHERHPGCEEEEDGPFHATQHGQEALRDEEGEEEVGRHGHALACGSGVEGEDLAGDEPA